MVAGDSDDFGVIDTDLPVSGALVVVDDGNEVKSGFDSNSGMNGISSVEVSGTSGDESGRRAFGNSLAPAGPPDL